MWFYIGFFVVGFYVYDFVDNDIYVILSCKISESVFLNFLIFEVVNYKDNCGMIVFKRGKFCELKYLIMKRS